MAHERCRSSRWSFPLAAALLAAPAAADAVFDAATAALHEPTGAARAAEVGLAADAARYARNAEALDLWRLRALDRALARLIEEAEAGRLEEAAAAAIEAHAVAEDPATVLENPAVVDLVGRMDATARAAEAGADFVTAASLFGRLNLLFERSDRYREDAERVQHHVGLVGLYRPDELARQIRERDRRLGRDVPEAPEDGDAGPDWRDRLAGIDRGMAAKAMVRAADTHIRHRGYGPPLAGGLAAMRALAQTPELRAEFPGLLDEEPRQAWVDRLVELESFARTFGEDLGRDRAEAMLAEALDGGESLVPEEVRVHEFAQGALEALDPFTGMFWPSDLDELRRATQGAFFGVGIRISLRDLTLTVSSPLANTPAADAGLQAGDQIVSVDGRSTAGWTLPRAVRAITGPEGTEVVLGVRREGEEEVREVSITRKRIDLDSVQGWALRPSAEAVEPSDTSGWNFWLDRDAGIAYARVTQFLPQTADDLNAAIAACEAEGDLRGLVIDLRFNPGGLLGAAIEVADRFVAGGPLLDTIDAEDKVRDRYHAKKRGTLTDLPARRAHQPRLRLRRRDRRRHPRRHRPRRRDRRAELRQGLGAERLLEPRRAEPEPAPLGHEGDHAPLPPARRRGDPPRARRRPLGHRPDRRGRGARPGRRLAGGAAAGARRAPRRRRLGPPPDEKPPRGRADRVGAARARRRRRPRGGGGPRRHAAGPAGPRPRPAARRGAPDPRDRPGGSRRDPAGRRGRVSDPEPRPMPDLFAAEPPQKPAADAPWPVSKLAGAIQAVLADKLPRKLRVVGEISNLSARNHWFFSLKDGDASIRAVMFASAARRVSFDARDGLSVVATGRIDYYAAQGSVQLYVDALQAVGEGELEAAFRRLAAELREEGLFAPERKKPLPAYPRAIAVVTSRSAAALQDVRDTARRRWPGCRLVLVDVRVQGPSAAPQIAAALGRLSEGGAALGIDAVLLTRGGGSIEDLWAFNEPEVVRAVAACSLPTVAAIGHETDTTLAELAADARCATPTQAAMTLVPDEAQLREQTAQLHRRLSLSLTRRLEIARSRVDAASRHRLFTEPARLVADARDPRRCRRASPPRRRPPPRRR